MATACDSVVDLTLDDDAPSVKHVPVAGGVTAKKRPRPSSDDDEVLVVGERAGTNKKEMVDLRNDSEPANVTGDVSDTVPPRASDCEARLTLVWFCVRNRRLPRCCDGQSSWRRL